MIIALASMHDLPTVIVPGGVTLPPFYGEDAGKVQTIGARYSNGELSLKEASELGCRACATSGGGCQFLGTAATAQVVGEVVDEAPRPVRSPCCTGSIRTSDLEGNGPAVCAGCY